MRNNFLVDVDWLNTRFILFLYFLTRVGVSEGSSLISKKKTILRNLFFVFLFSIYRIKFFFEISTFNPALSMDYLEFPMNPSRYFETFPKKLFLVFYSPFRVTFTHGSALSLLRKREYFLKRLETINLHVYNNSKTCVPSSNSKQTNKVGQMQNLLSTHLNPKVGTNLDKKNNFSLFKFLKYLSEFSSKFSTKKVFTRSKNFHKKELRFRDSIRKKRIPNNCLKLNAYDNLQTGNSLNLIYSKFKNLRIKNRFFYGFRLNYELVGGEDLMIFFLNQHLKLLEFLNCL